jgi:hypothetical protein
MKTRLIAAGTVFGVGFIVGLGLTYALLSDQPEGVRPPENGATAAESGAGATESAESAAGAASEESVDSPATAPTMPVASDAKPAEKKWWVGLKGKTCKIDMGRAGALIVRQGGLEDGEVVNWMTRFGRNPRIGLIPKDEHKPVLVHGVGVDITNVPVAAMVTVELDGNKKTGIIALHTQGLNVSLVPIK